MVTSDDTGTPSSISGIGSDGSVTSAIEDFTGAPRPGDTLQFGQGGTRYELVRSLGRGGYAEVFLARQLGADGFSAQVAVKCILADMDESESARREFLDEARLASRLRHPNIAAAYDLAVSHERYYLVLEYVDGATARSVRRAARARGRPLSEGFCCHVAASVAEALHHAHALTGDDGATLGVVHRDVTAANVMVSRTGEVKLLDFGVAFARLEGRERTRTGLFRGTSAYASPEQASGDELDGRSDLFSLGRVLVELLTGVRVYEDDSGWDGLERVIECRPEEVKAATASLPRGLAKICERALAREPSDRFQDGVAFSRALREYLTKSNVTYGQADCAAELEVLGVCGHRGEEQEFSASKSGAAPRASAPPARTLRRRRRVLVAAGAVLPVLLALFAVGLNLAGKPRAHADSAAAPVASREPKRPSTPTPAASTSPQREPDSATPPADPVQGAGDEAIEPVVRPRRMTANARAPGRTHAATPEVSRAPATPRTSFAEFADRITVANLQATLPRGTLVPARLLQTLDGRAAARAEALVTEEVAVDGVVLVPKGATVSCAARPPSDGRVPLACDAIRAAGRMLAFTGVAVGEGQHIGLRMRDDEIAAGTPFVVYVSAPAALR